MVGDYIEEFDEEGLQKIVCDLENEQALWEEKAYGLFRLAELCQTKVEQAEQVKSKILSILSRLHEAKDLYGTGRK